MASRAFPPSVCAALRMRYDPPRESVVQGRSAGREMHESRGMSQQHSGKGYTGT